MNGYCRTLARLALYFDCAVMQGYDFLDNRKPKSIAAAIGDENADLLFGWHISFPED